MKFVLMMLFSLSLGSCAHAYQHQCIDCYCTQNSAYQESRLMASIVELVVHVASHGSR